MFIYILHGLYGKLDDQIDLRLQITAFLGKKIRNYRFLFKN